MPKTTEEWKNSENEIERMAYWINWLSPHNLHKAKPALEELLRHTREEAKKDEDEKIIKMLWSIHEDENDEEMEAWNRSLDLAIFRIKNPILEDTPST